MILDCPPHQVSGARAEQETEVATLSRHRAHSLQQQLSSCSEEVGALKDRLVATQSEL